MTLNRYQDRCSVGAVLEQFWGSFGAGAKIVAVLGQFWVSFGTVLGSAGAVQGQCRGRQLHCMARQQHCKAVTWHGSSVAGALQGPGSSEVPNVCEASIGNLIMIYIIN